MFTSVKSVWTIVLGQLMFFSVQVESSSGNTVGHATHRSAKVSCSNDVRRTLKNHSKKCTWVIDVRLNVVLTVYDVDHLSALVFDANVDKGSCYIFSFTRVRCDPYLQSQ